MYPQVDHEELSRPPLRAVSYSVCSRELVCLCRGCSTRVRGLSYHQVRPICSCTRRRNRSSGFSAGEYAITVVISPAGCFRTLDVPSPHAVYVLLMSAASRRFAVFLCIPHSRTYRDTIIPKLQKGGSSAYAVAHRILRGFPLEAICRV